MRNLNEENDEVREFALNLTSSAEEPAQVIGNRILELLEFHEDHWIDEHGTVWNRPTSWAYAQACKARDKWQAEATAVAKSIAGASIEAADRDREVYPGGAGNPSKEIFEENGRWFFWDETWSLKYGPYRDEWEAKDALARYVRELG